MAKKSFTIEPIEEKKMEIGKVIPATAEKKKDMVIITFKGSWTYHSMRYEGTHTWAADDPRLTAAKGLYTVNGRK